jgi:tetratricopeptide (TPR) repeat protein
LKAVLLESRPIEVEAWYYRWNDYVAADPDARITLAETFFSMGQYQAAVIQIKKSFRDRKPGIREFFLLAECFIHLGLYAESLAAVEKVLSLDQEHGDALREKANLLYLLNRFLEARDFTEGLIDKGLGGSFLYNLLGNAEYGLGNWEKAAFAYRNALRAEPAMPLFAMNAGRAFEMAGMREEALASYVDAAKEFFRQEAFEDISLACERIRSIDRNNVDARIIVAKLLFNSQRYEEAGKLLRSVRGAGDSSVPFSSGSWNPWQENREEALGFFNEAAALEPDFPLYRFKLAENLYLSGREAESRSRRRSASLPMMYGPSISRASTSSTGGSPQALSLLKEAHEKAPSEADIRINYSEVLARLSQYSSALALLDGAEPDARVYNQKGNLLSSSGDTEKALEAHQAALRLDPENPVILENCAASALAADRIALAEELLVRLLDSAPSERAFRMMGDTARALGEYRRAEAAYREALKLAPADQPALICLAELCLSTGRYAEAAEAARSVNDPAYKYRSERVLSQVKRATETRYACASCGRVWWVPKNIPSQGTVRLIGEPEDESPAGMCPLCGKVYCVSCAKGTLKDNRFICPDCGEYLKLQDDGLKFLAAGYAAGAHRAP